MSNYFCYKPPSQLPPPCLKLPTNVFFIMANNIIVYFCREVVIALLR